MKPIVAALGVVTLAAACAARGPSPQTIAEGGRAAQLVREGCYGCLVEAVSIYERLASLPQPLPDAAARGFEAAVLLHVREKELGIPADASSAKARALAARIGPASAPARRGTKPPPPSPPAATLLDAAAIVLGDMNGLDPPGRREASLRIGSTPRSKMPGRLALDPFVPSSLAAAYLALTIDCEDTLRKDPVPTEPALAAHGAPPLLRYRARICRGRPEGDIGAMREADPRWLDTLYFEGRLQMLGFEPNVEAAAALYTQAHEAFPSSPAITITLANTHQQLANYEPALEKYDAILANAPTHRDAMLGRLTSLSYLMRHKDAIPVADRLIELGTWHIGDAYYWRAWNRYHLEQLDVAWADVETARKLIANTSVYMLAGLIAYGRKEPEIALDRFDEAYRLDRTNCEAVWMGALIHVELQAWNLATPKFVSSIGCFKKAAAEARGMLAKVDAAANASAELKARRRAIFQKLADTGEHRAAQGAFNATQGYLRANDKANARIYLEMAAEHPLLKEKAESLRKFVEQEQVRH